jgi:hypothetical protein
LPTDQYARVPIELLQLVDAPALQLYVALCKYAGKRGHCWPSNAELSDVTSQSDAAVRRSLKQLVDVGAITRVGRQRRVITVVPLDRLSLTHERKSARSIAHPRAIYRSPVSDVTRCIEPDNTPPLRDDVCDDESERAMQAAPEEPMFEIERVEHETPIGAACLAAFLDAYGVEPISRPMIGRLGKRFKELAASYSREELLAAAVDLGARRVAHVNAIEPFLLRARQPAQQSRDGWSRLAEDTYAQLPDPFAHHG